MLLCCIILIRDLHFIKCRRQSLPLRGDHVGSWRITVKQVKDQVLLAARSTETDRVFIMNVN